MAKPPSIAFECKFDAESMRIFVRCLNHSRQEVCIVTLVRYLNVELMDRRGKFTSGTPHNRSIEMPKPGDYVTIKANAVLEDVFVLSVERLDTGDDPGERSYAVGNHRFDKFPAKTEVRVSYKPERMMPNLPSSKQRRFVADLVVGQRLKVVFP